MDAVGPGGQGGVDAAVHQDLHAGALVPRRGGQGRHLLHQRGALQLPGAHLHAVHAAGHRRGHGLQQRLPGRRRVGDQAEDGEGPAQKRASPSSGLEAVA
jgi:hypothetical protein